MSFFRFQLNVSSTTPTSNAVAPSRVPAVSTTPVTTPIPLQPISSLPSTPIPPPASPSTPVPPPESPSTSTPPPESSTTPSRSRSSARYTRAQEAVLIECWTGSYRSYHRGSNNTEKSRIAKAVHDAYKERTNDINRTEKALHTKLSALMTQYKDINDRISATGSGGGPPTWVHFDAMQALVGDDPNVRPTMEIDSIRDDRRIRGRPVDEVEEEQQQQQQHDGDDDEDEDEDQEDDEGQTTRLGRRQRTSQQQSRRVRIRRTGTDRFLDSVEAQRETIDRQLDRLHDAHIQESQQHSEMFERYFEFMRTKHERDQAFQSNYLDVMRSIASNRAPSSPSSHTSPPPPSHASPPPPSVQTSSSPSQPSTRTQPQNPLFPHDNFPFL
ncbi:unnamed protein product [Absidia cylindrospora]